MTEQTKSKFQKEFEEQTKRLKELYEGKSLV